MRRYGRSSAEDIVRAAGPGVPLQTRRCTRRSLAAFREALWIADCTGNESTGPSFGRRLPATAFPNGRVRRRVTDARLLTPMGQIPGSSGC